MSNSSSDEEEIGKDDILPQTQANEIKPNHPDYYKLTLRDPGQEGRKASRIYFLRNFNNWVKACLINKYTFKIGKNASILDLCCGRGGDLLKFFQSNIKIYVGSDIVEELLLNAMDRIEKIKNERFQNKKFNTKCILIEDDLSGPNSILLKKIPDKVEFDIVACQFALHYHFESEERIRQFLKNVVTKLNPGEYFFGTIIDSDVLIKRLRSMNNNKEFIQNNPYKGQKFTFGNDFYSVKFFQKRFPKDKPFGIRYFFLEDSIDTRDSEGNVSYVYEYLIMFKVLVDLAKEYELELIEDFNFEEFYERNLKEVDQESISIYLELFNRMVKVEKNDKSARMQWDIIKLYKVFCFRKIPKGKTIEDFEKYTCVHSTTNFDWNMKPELKLQNFFK